MMRRRSHSSITNQITPRRTSSIVRPYRQITPAGLLGMLFGLGLLAPTTTRALDLTAGTETELADAIAQVNNAGAGTHTITLTGGDQQCTADIEIVNDGTARLSCLCQPG